MEIQKVSKIQTTVPIFEKGWLSYKQIRECRIKLYESKMGIKCKYILHKHIHRTELVDIKEGEPYHKTSCINNLVSTKVF